MSATVVVTGIGGNVGQGILRNIRRRFPDLRLVGTNNEAFSGGNHLCDAVYAVPFGDSEAYLPAIADIVARESAALIVPATDLEAHHLSVHRAALPAAVAVSPAESTALFLDKWRTAEAFARHGIAFAASCLPDEYCGQFPRVLAKPRAGRGSRGVVRDPERPDAFAADHVLQELLDGPELTTAFYVTRAGALLGQLTMERRLANGATERCRVTHDHDAEIESIVRAMVAHFPLVGSINVQSIVVAGSPVPFEVNARISGTNSIRWQFGFDDVTWTIEEWLHGGTPGPPRITGGTAVRVLTDVVYPELDEPDALAGASAATPHAVF